VRKIATPAHKATPGPRRRISRGAAWGWHVPDRHTRTPLTRAKTRCQTTHHARHLVFDPFRVGRTRAGRQRGSRVGCGTTPPAFRVCGRAHVR
jgi:hypothetical protein